jgi:hypothetical protein
VDDVGRVQEFEGTKGVISNHSHVVLSHASGVTELYHVFEVVRTLFHHNKQTQIAAISQEHVEQHWRICRHFANVYHLFEGPHDHDFSGHFDQVVVVRIELSHPLDCHGFASSLTLSFNNLAKTSFSQFLYYIISFINGTHPVRIKLQFFKFF